MPEIRFGSMSLVTRAAHTLTIWVEDGRVLIDSVYWEDASMRRHFADAVMLDDLLRAEPAPVAAPEDAAR